jgi:hypothetical protein
MVLLHPPEVRFVAGTEFRNEVGKVAHAIVRAVVDESAIEFQEDGLVANLLGRFEVKIGAALILQHEQTMQAALNALAREAEKALVKVISEGRSAILRE